MNWTFTASTAARTRAILPMAAAVLLVTALAAPRCQEHSPPPAEGETAATGPAAGATSPEPTPRDRPEPPGAAVRRAERETMVERQIARPRDGRTPVPDERVLEAMRRVPRHLFVPESRRVAAYDDTPLPIGEGQTISQPYIVALMTELLEVRPGSRILEIGTGSGYQAAVLAHLTDEVYSVEIIEPLHARAADVLTSQGYDEVHTRRADGYHGWAEHGPYDGIIVTCAAGHLPPPLWEQLRPGGRIVIPIGGPYELQRLVLVTKAQDGTRESRTITAVRFVPLTRAPAP